MRNLWVFLFRNRAFFWFLSFEILALYLVVKNNTFQGAIFMSSANQLAGNVFEKQSQFTDYLYLNRANDSLAKENARLRLTLPSSYYGGISIPHLISDTANQVQYSFLVCKVINNSTTHRNNYLTLDKGSLQGIKPGMGVLSPMGIAGIIKEVSTHFSTANSLLHKDSHFSVRLKRTKEIGSLVWEGTNAKIVSLKDIPNSVDIKKGDSVETSGFSLFPQGIFIGTVSRFYSNNGESSYTVDIKLNTDFNSMQYVYVVVNKLAMEQHKLEQKQEEKVDK